jgi:hypothetical protein
MHATSAGTAAEGLESCGDFAGKAGSHLKHPHFYSEKLFTISCTRSMALFVGATASMVRGD